MRSLAFITLALAVVGCRSVKGPITGKTYYLGFSLEGYEQEVRQFYVMQHPAISKEFRDAILAKKIMRGMSEEQVRVAWMIDECSNLEVHETVGPWGIHKQYVVRRPGEGWSRMYLYFEDGTLASWQD